MLKNNKMLRALLTASLACLLLLSGCGAQSDSNAPKNGIPIVVGQSIIQLCNWKGDVSGNEVLIKASEEQLSLLQTDGNRIVVYLVKQDVMIDEVTLKIGDKKDDGNTEVALSLDIDQKLDGAGDIEVYLYKTDAIVVKKSLVLEDENGKYIWKVENIMGMSGNSEQTNSTRQAEKLINPQKVYIETGFSNEYDVVVTSGLSEGDVIARPEE